MNHGGARRGAGRPKDKGLYGEATKPIRIPLSLISFVTEGIKNKGYRLPLYSSKIQAGAPASADDDIEAQININEYLIKQAASTFLIRVSGESMVEAGIHHNDILVVDSSIRPQCGQIGIFIIDGQLTVKKLNEVDKQFLLMPANAKFNPIIIKEGNEVYSRGTVTYVIHAV